MGQSTGPKPDRRKGAMFRCVICGGEFYRPQSLIKRGITKTCGKFECKCENAGPKPGPRPYRLNGATFKCVICGKEFYRKRSFIERGITNTCGKSACKSRFFSGSKACPKTLSSPWSGVSGRQSKGLAKLMTAAQIETAQRLAREWKPGPP
jgi:hypothetical protein